MDEYRLLNKKFAKEKKEEVGAKKMLFRILSQIMISVILLLVALIGTRNVSFKNELYKYVYQDNLSFKEIEGVYKKYFGEILPNDWNDNTEFVSSEKMEYSKAEELDGGVRLSIKKNSIVSAFEGGLVLFVGEKEGYGNTLILEQVDGVEAWYIGVDTNDLKIYDYVDANAIIGTSMKDTIDLYFKRSGEVVDYKNYVF